MKLSRNSVHRPVFVIMVTLIVIIIGGISLSRLPIDLMPDISYPTLSISTSYSNASPEEIEDLITRPIEEAVSAVPGVEEVESESSEGSSRVRITFAWGTDVDAAANDVRDRLDRVIAQLPDDADRPSLRKFDTAATPILFLGASSEMEINQLRQFIEDQMLYRLERVNGVAAVDINGGLLREIHVDLKADRLRALNISPNQVIERLRAGNINLPAGSIEQGNIEYTVRTPGEYQNVAQVADTVIAMRDGAPIPLREIATVTDTFEEPRRYVRVNGKPGIRITISKQSGSNTVEVARGVMREVEALRKDYPQIEISTIIDQAAFIQQSIDNLSHSAMFGSLLAILVLLFFLRSVRSTVVIAIAIPISIIATFALMYFAGFTLNMMTLGGLALGVGMLVDTSIVVLENIYRIRDEEKIEAKAAAIKGSEEVGAAIIASTMTTLVVFLPLVFLRGMTGVMFKQLAYVISFSLICSLAVSLTMTPMLAARLLALKPSTGNGSSLKDRLFAKAEAAMNALDWNYKGLLHRALNHCFLVILAAVAVFGSSLLLIPLIGNELMPAVDEGEVRIDAEAATGTRVEIVNEQFRQVEQIVAEEVPELKSSVAYIGGSFRSSNSNEGELRVSLVPASQRERSAEEIATALRPSLSKIPGFEIRTRQGSSMFMMRTSQSSDELEVIVRGHDLLKSAALADQVGRVLEGIEGVTDVQVSREAGAPEELVHIDRQKAADMKLTVSQIAQMLQTVLGGSRAGYFRDGGNQYRIVVRLEEGDRVNLRDVLDLTLINAEGDPVVLRNVIQTRSSRGPQSIERLDQERVITISGAIAGRDMSAVIADAQEAMRSVPVPPDFSINFAGDYEEQVRSFRELFMSFVLSLILVYMVMACLYESLLDPLVVMFSVPMAAIGVCLMLFLTHTTFNIQSYIGCIMLGGIVVNNAILLVDQANLLRRVEGFSVRDAIEEAGRRRLRPILMTASTTLLGLLPLAIGWGEGAEAQAPLARAVIGGILSSTLITLIFVPVVYYLAESAAEAVRGRRAAAIQARERAAADATSAVVSAK